MQSPNYLPVTSRTISQPARATGFSLYLQIGWLIIHLIMYHWNPMRSHIVQPGQQGDRNTTNDPELCWLACGRRWQDRGGRGLLVGSLSRDPIGREGEGGKGPSLFFVISSETTNTLATFSISLDIHFSCHPKKKMMYGNFMIRVTKVTSNYVQTHLSEKVIREKKKTEKFVLQHKVKI